MKKENKDRFLTLILIVSLLVIIVSSVMIFLNLKDYLSSNSLYDNMGKSYVTIEDSPIEDSTKSGDAAPSEESSETESTQSEQADSTTDAEDWPEVLSVDMEQLKAMNPDIYGWIWFENEDISYPIVWSGDNSTYLRRSVDGKKATAGTIFIEGKNAPDFQDYHTILYGHNMRNLSMFGKLKYYYRNEDYYESHQYFQIATENGVNRYRIFAYEITDMNSFIYTVGYQPDSAYEEFIQKIEKASMRSTDIPVTVEDRIITLSTCTSGDNRFVVHAVLVDSRE